MWFMMVNNNGFADAAKKLDRLSKINNHTILLTLEEAAIYFANVLRPNIPRANRNSKHLNTLINVKIEDNQVIVYFESDGFYWRFVEHGSVHQRAQNFIKSTYMSNRDKIEKIMTNKILKKLEE
ncbi:hypothetical protein HU17_00080 [Listeria monocytogenes]|nr:hypothetical protein [Listeria monocytogenes]EAC8350561.1 hypothetical protein [Listeria monocytogenes]EAD0739951.1 hypothetical protein [Listeria monocytogenes]EAD9140312.1 hypothetical protein [Listeria monocytogenes]MBC6364025.1 hypothetical protein [Listeria monocytogenes]